MCLHHCSCKRSCRTGFESKSLAARMQRQDSWAGNDSTCSETLQAHRFRACNHSSVQTCSRCNTLPHDASVMARLAGSDSNYLLLGAVRGHVTACPGIKPGPQCSAQGMQCAHDALQMQALAHCRLRCDGSPHCLDWPPAAMPVLAAHMAGPRTVLGDACMPVPMHAP